MTSQMTSRSELAGQAELQFSMATDDPLAKVKPSPRYAVIDLADFDTDFDEELYDRLIECDAVGHISFCYQDMRDCQFILLTEMGNNSYLATLVSSRTKIHAITKGDHTTITCPRDIAEGDIDLEDLLCSLT